MGRWRPGEGSEGSCWALGAGAGGERSRAGRAWLGRESVRGPRRERGPGVPVRVVRGPGPGGPRAGPEGRRPRSGYAGRENPMQFVRGVGPGPPREVGRRGPCGV